ncbi:hypothetical protein SEA_ANNADREAMY_232 [Streptomyces phage Annadreamy]|uniref:Uncharacterized protein n=2 Tax=Annadreamyvirus annadreamy TaxID=2846392 RepID=A0A345GTP3_9CAUD|nr:hypothetical protein HWB75_gp046 [Streptomyces phage Annadreamy]AXG66315.1 hypothetical protein SEA_ANNADREAMY_232 [Streptomyces phage Annadreamy]QGH79540.1 hypothetical protein SEA_LIMPID_239 [Streptomyces phage Limpid]
MNFRIDVLAENGVPFRAVFFPFGESENYPSVNTGEPMVEFYDKRYVNHTPDGQFTGARYNLSDLFEDRKPFSGLILDGGVESWRIDGDTFELVVRWLKSFEVLPG